MVFAATSARNTRLAIIRLNTKALSDREFIILKKFGEVFEQTYTRFQDLKKAESQAKELEIEAGLERVRSRTMAMYKSEELSEIVQVLHHEMQALHLEIDVLQIHENKKDENFNLWISTTQINYPTQVKFPRFSHPLLDRFVEAADKKEDYFYIILDRRAKNSFYRRYFKSANIQTPSERQAILLKKKSLMMAVSVQKYTDLAIVRFNQKTLAREEIMLLTRFGHVFEQAYTRFLDLHKAETQAREAQIEVSLERVRSRSMGMQNSSELAEVSEVLFQELRALGSHLWACGFVLCTEEHDISEHWMSVEAGKLSRVQVPVNLDHVHRSMYNAWLQKEELFSIEIGGDDLIRHYEQMRTIPVLNHNIERATRKQFRAPKWQKNFVASFQYGYLLIVTIRPIEQNNFYPRFAKVFEQCYTRFLDLKKAETQAREAQIGAALERVRSRSMAMHESREIGQVVVLIYRELRTLGFTDYMNCGYIEIDENQHIQKAWMTNMGADFQENFTLPLTGDPVLDERYNNWKQGKPYFHQEVGGEALRAHIEFVAPQMQSSKWAAITTQDLPDPTHFNNSNFSHGYLQLETAVQLDSEDISLLIRFTQVFEQTYTRFLDLLKAEELTRETAREAALDRVRAEISSMRTSEDLQRITPVIWKELRALQVPFFRCGTFIIDQTAKMLHAYLATPDGQPVAALHLDAHHSSLVRNAWQSWQRQEIYIEKWTQAQFEKWTQSLLSIRQIDDASHYQVGKKAPNNLVLQFLPFQQGMLYVGSKEPLSDNQLKDVQNLADAFSIAYARYEDFTQLEHAKNQVENTLVELKAAQEQLIHSEKMASLGELTAGIAHEIQNPLNFVNNFSEVSSEILEEMREALQNQNIQDVQLIFSDLKENLQKIHHHGDRASSIVKGMLDHSRASATEKVMIDINKLCDEYTRLAYHGLRAKDKNFQSNYDLELDPDLPEIKVVAQDIGRAILNLLNNAFYTVHRKKQVNADIDYQPHIKLTTTLIDGGIQIQVNDNGEGMSKGILEKIFQPFFTTKPAGKGTGLGLSLAYDIVTNGHQGQLLVNTKKGEGTTFVIQLPLQTNINSTQ